MEERAPSLVIEAVTRCLAFKGAIAQASRESVAGRHTLRPQKLTLRLCRVAAQPSSVHIQLRISVPGRPPREGCLASRVCHTLELWQPRRCCFFGQMSVVCANVDVRKGDVRKTKPQNRAAQPLASQWPWHSAVRREVTGSIPARRSRIPLIAECENANVLRLSCTLKISVGQKLIQRTPPPLHLRIHALIWSRLSL